MAPTNNEPTPAGGDRSVATYYDATGAVVHDPAAAHTVEITEHTRDGDELRRTYMTRSTGAAHDPDPGTTMTDGDFAEHVKGTWDVWDSKEGIVTRVDTLAALLSALGYDRSDLATQRSEVSTLMVLPSWGAAPAGLKLEVNRWLEATRQPSQEPAPQA